MRSDGALDRVRVHLDTTVIEERRQARQVAERVTHGLRQFGAAGDARQMVLQPIVQSLNNRPTSVLSYSLSVLG
jgi:hypothetical protein